MTLKDRVKVYCDRKNIAVTKFERMAGLSNGYFKENTKRMSDDKIESIHRAFPDLNIDWLLTGNGEMLKGEAIFIDTPAIEDVAEVVEDKRVVDVSILAPNAVVEVEINALMQTWHTTPEKFAEIIGEDVAFVRACNGRLHPCHIMKLQDYYGTAVVEKYAKFTNTIEAEIIESFPVLPEEVTTSPNTDIVKYVEENGSELETINPNQLLNDAKVDVAERIKRTSMLPTFQPDDTVFIRFIKDKMKIVDGETYYLDCKNRPTMIRLVKFEPDGKLRLIAKNSQYGDIVIDRTDIINIGVVVALFRMTFGDQYSELETLRREKDAEREKKDSQIDKMLEMMQAQGEQQSKLIDYITKGR